MSHITGTNTETPSSPGRYPLWAQVLLGLVLGATMGALFGREPYLAGLGNEDLGALGMLVIRLLKALAVPLVLFSILDALIRNRIPARSGARLLAFCGLNVSVAMIIGLTMMNLLNPGVHLREHLEHVMTDPNAIHAPPKPIPASLSPIKNIEGFIPESLLDPLVKNHVIGVVLIGLLIGLAFRRVKDRQMAEGESGYEAVEGFVAATYQALVQALSWIVRAVPFAVFGLIAQAVGRAGLGVFAGLWIFVVVILGGMAIHALVYYPLAARFIGGLSPRRYLGGGADAILTGLATNSSLATVPITLQCLTEKMGVSPPSARLSACVGTNLNNDGITLYEAMTALFVAQACGFDLSLGRQAVVVLASIMAGIGIAGIPEAGLVVLPLVLGTAGLPDVVVAAAIPLVIPADVVLARARSALNVMNDMLIAAMIDHGASPEPRPDATDACAPNPVPGNRPRT